MAVPVPQLTPEEYLALERAAATKSEYWLGQVYAMAGVTFAHDRIHNNLSRHLGNQLEGGPCQVMGPEMKVGVDRGKRGFAYPDAFILCGPPVFLDEHEDVVTNPLVIFEILSPSTEQADRGRKFAEYRRLATLRHYVLVSQSQMTVEHYQRQADGSWLLVVLEGGGVLRLADAGVELALGAVYQGVAVGGEG